MNEVTFNSADRRIPIRNRNGFKKAIQRVFALENYKLSAVSYIFCSDAYLLQLNNQYLKHNFYTDILTFLISSLNEPIVSEVYISIDRVKENAKLFEISYQNELLRVMIHGALHLCGYDDQTIKAKEQMRQKEDFYIQLYTDSRET
jgi:probable rRNA maturation factor